MVRIGGPVTVTGILVSLLLGLLVVLLREGDHSGGKNAEQAARAERERIRRVLEQKKQGK